MAEPATSCSLSAAGGGGELTNLHVPYQLLEITIISAQDLAPVSKSMRTYAVGWVEQERKLSTRVDQLGHANPTWNDKLVFQVKHHILSSDASAVVVEIYTQSWLRDTLVGTVRVLINHLIPPASRSPTNTTTRFVALQIRRPSGAPQGILNMGVTLLDTSTPTDVSVPADDPHDRQGQAESSKDQFINEKIQLWRSRSMGLMEMNGEEEEEDDCDMAPKPADSICNGSSIVNGGSELCSDVGPSASVVAAAIAKGMYPTPAVAAATDGGAKASSDENSSIIEDLTVEEAKAKGYNSAKMGPSSKAMTKTNPRRHSDGGGGLFSCFGNAYGFEFTIVCGAKDNNGGTKKKKLLSIGANRIHVSPSDQNLRKSPKTTA